MFMRCIWHWLFLINMNEMIRTDYCNANGYIYCERKGALTVRTETCCRHKNKRQNCTRPWHMSAEVRLHAQSECLQVQSTRQASKAVIIWMTKQLRAFCLGRSQSRQVVRLVSIKAQFLPHVFLSSLNFEWCYSVL